jgi:hypothetical protein
MNPLSSQFGGVYVVKRLHTTTATRLVQNMTMTFPLEKVRISACESGDRLSLAVKLPDTEDKLFEQGLVRIGLGDKFTKQPPPSNDPKPN